MLKLNRHQKTVMQACQKARGKWRPEFNAFRGVKNIFYSSKLAAWADADGNFQHISQMVGFSPLRTVCHTYARTHARSTSQGQVSWELDLQQFWDKHLMTNGRALIPGQLSSAPHTVGSAVQLISACQWGKSLFDDVASSRFGGLLVVGGTFSHGVSAEFLFPHFLEPE